MIPEKLKSLFSKPYQRMGGASVRIQGPLPSVGCCYDVERAVKKLGLGGWMRYVDQTDLVLEIYGAHESVNQFIQQIQNGSVLRWRPMVDTMSLPYQDNYPTFVFKIFDIPNAPSRKLP